MNDASSYSDHLRGIDVVYINADCKLAAADERSS